jgi:Phosphotransferase enzyme family
VASVSNPPLGLLAAGETAAPLAHNATNDATGGIWRVDGPAGERSVLKIARPGVADGPWGTSDEPTHWNYWKREYLAYSTGFAASAYQSGSVLAPSLLDSAALADGGIAFRLAYVDGTPGGAWTVARYRDLAVRLGVAQAGWLGVTPGYPWLSRWWLRQYLERREIRADVPWDHPVIAAAWPEPVRIALARLAASWPTMLAAVEALPRTLAHLDVWPANLIWAAGGPTLLDWAFVGAGSVGEDIGNLVIDSVADGHIDVALWPELVSTVTDGYVEGLAGAVPADVVVGGIKASACAKYAWFGPRAVARIAREEGVGSRFYDVGGTVAEKLARWRPMVALLAQWTREILDG